MIEVKENATDGSLVTVLQAETVSVPGGESDQDLWIEIGRALERLGPDAQARAMAQIRNWTTAAGKTD